jgi:hypothetical protein
MVFRPVHPKDACYSLQIELAVQSRIGLRAEINDEVQPIEFLVLNLSSISRTA